MYKLFVLLLIAGFIISFTKVDFSGDLRNANRESSFLAPSPSSTVEAVFEIYEAREYKWKGLVSTHSWIAVKPSYSRHYTVYQVNRFLVNEQKPMVEIKEDVPDRLWYGNKPKLVCELRGKEAVSAIKKLKNLAASYPYQNKYDFFPGPNANTFTQFMINNISEIDGTLSPLALGKDYHENAIKLESTPSGTGYKLSLKGVLQFSLAKEEGFLLSIFGFTMGLNPNAKQIVLPLVGIIEY